MELNSSRYATRRSRVASIRKQNTMAVKVLSVLVMTVSITCAGVAQAGEPKGSTDLTVLVQEAGAGGEAVKDATVFVSTGGDRREERDTNGQGRAEFRSLPRTTVRVQVIAHGRKTFGKDYSLSQNREIVTIKLEKSGKY